MLLDRLIRKCSECFQCRRKSWEWSIFFPAFSFYDLLGSTSFELESVVSSSESEISHTSIGINSDSFSSSSFSWYIKSHYFISLFTRVSIWLYAYDSRSECEPLSEKRHLHLDDQSFILVIRISSIWYIIRSSEPIHRGIDRSLSDTTSWFTFTGISPACTRSIGSYCLKFSSGVRRLLRKSISSFSSSVGTIEFPCTTVWYGEWSTRVFRIIYDEYLTEKLWIIPPDFSESCGTTWSGSYNYSWYILTIFERFDRISTQAIEVMMEELSYYRLIGIGKSDEIGIEEGDILYRFEVFSFYLCQISLFFEFTNSLDIWSLSIRYHRSIRSSFYF